MSLQPSNPMPQDLLEILVDQSDDESTVEVINMPNVPMLDSMRSDGVVAEWCFKNGMEYEEDGGETEEVVRGGSGEDEPVVGGEECEQREGGQCQEDEDECLDASEEILDSEVDEKLQTHRKVRTIGKSSSGGWMRGNPLQEQYAVDEELPANIQKEIRRNLASTTTKRGMEEGLQGVNDYDINEPFEWKPNSEFAGVREKFRPKKVGPTVSFGSGYEAMQAMWHGILPLIVVETNRYAQSLAAERPRFKRDWVDTNVDELWILFAFWMMLGIVKMPTIKSCFSKIELLETRIFRKLFKESRYWNLNAAFHLAEGSDPSNLLHALGPVPDHLNKKFKELYQLDQEIAVDESLILWKGPLRFQQYIKTKASRYGIKTYQVCESATGYLWSFFIYTGHEAVTSPKIPSCASTVLRLIHPILDLGHTLYMDNWFNSPTLARWLKRRNTDCVGTLRVNRKHVPLSIKKCPLSEGQFVARASDSVLIVALQDRRRVTCLSTYHDLSQIQKATNHGRSSQYKLKLIDDYNHLMIGVDRMDQMLEPYLVERKQCIKWNLKFFKRLLNQSINNSRIMVQHTTNSKIDSLSFRLALVQEIILKHLSRVPQPRQRNSSTGLPLSFPPNRLTERHFIRKTPITDEMRQTVVHKQNLGRRQCVWCKARYKKRTNSQYECTECRLAMCIPNCFKEFHTIP